jgi:hypothetical protein
MVSGSFSFEALQAYEALIAETHPLNFSDGDTHDFTRCLRPNGTIYGSRGKCKQGTEIGAKEESQVKGKRGPKAGGMRLTEKIKGLGAEDLKKVLQDPRVTPKQRAVLEGLLKSKGEKAPEGRLVKQGTGRDRKTSREELRKAVSENNPKVQDEYDWVGSGPKAVAEIKRSYRMMQTLVKSPELDTVANKARLINLRLLIYQKEKELRERRLPGRDPKTYEAALRESPKYDKTPGSSSPIDKVVPELPSSPTLASLYKRQGFNAKPELVATVDDLRKRKDIVTNSDGSPLIFYRGVTSKEFSDQFKGLGSEGDTHYPGRGVHGNGSYSAGAAQDDSQGLRGDNGGGEDKAIRTATAYTGNLKNVSSKITVFAVRKDANIVQFQGETFFERRTEAMKWAERTVKDAKEKTGYTYRDLGEAAAALGIHAYTIPQHGEDYLVLLNRGAIIAAMDSQIPDENE